MDMSGDSFDSGKDASNRARDRNSLFLAGKMTFEGVRDIFDVRIRNLSATGLMAECKAPVHRGQKVSVETKGVGQITGVIAWAVDGRIGVAFDESINPEVAKTPVKVATPTMVVPDYLEDIRKPVKFERRF